MKILICISLFIIGTILGSIYNTIAHRLPIGKSLIKAKSHCPNCNHTLSFLEKIPVISYIIQKGKCKLCHKQISFTYPFFELLTAILFITTYLIFDINIDFFIAITFISMLIIIVNSDYQYMIINDSVLIFFGILLFIEYIIKGDINLALTNLFNGLIAFLLMLVIKLIGDLIFKKESMGGGDIKLMFIFGMVIGFPLAITSIFLASIIGLPISIIMVSRKTDSIVPFGPFLAISALILFMSQTTFTDLLNMIY